MLASQARVAFRPEKKWRNLLWSCYWSLMNSMSNCCCYCCYYCYSRRLNRWNNTQSTRPSTGWGYLHHKNGWCHSWNWPRGSRAKIRPLCIQCHPWRSLLWNSSLFSTITRGSLGQSYFPHRSIRCSPRGLLPSLQMALQRNLSTPNLNHQSRWYRCQGLTSPGQFRTQG
jgi:hypothetical protein